MQAKSSLSEKLSQLPVAQSKCKIYRVYEHLRNINNKAYEPEVIAIGPYHHGKVHLQMMEDHKLVCFRRILDKKNQNVDTYLSAIGLLGEKARSYYANTISLDQTEFIEMLILDGCFIIQLVREKLEDPLSKMGWSNSSLQRDLMLFENQIPFFVLFELFDLIKGPNRHRKLMCLLTEYYSPSFPKIKMSSNISSHEIKHLLGFIYVNLVSSFDWSVLREDTNAQEEANFVGGATSLTEANVKFQLNEESSSMFDIRFQRGTLYLPRLRIYDSTECSLRNLIAYEQYFPDTRRYYVSDYLRFLDCLINSQKDVQILSHAGIIENGLGDDTAVANIFNKLTDSIMVDVDDGFTYSKIIRMVNEHCKKRWNRWMAKLRRDYLNSPWAILSIIAAIVLLLLTIGQTVLSVLQVVL